MEIEYPAPLIEPPVNGQLKSQNLQDNQQESNKDNNKDEQPDIDWNDPTDTDKDGLTDVLEQYRYFTDMPKADTDEDGLKDGYEVEIGTDPTLPDTDGDTLLDREELKSLTPTKSISTAPYLKALNIMAGGSSTKVYVYEYTSKPMEQAMHFFFIKVI